LSFFEKIRYKSRYKSKSSVARNRHLTKSPPMKLYHFRQQCQFVLHNPMDFWGKLVNGIIALLIILSIAVVPLYFIPELAWAKRGLFLFEVFTAVVFTIEYILRVWSAEKPVQYVFSWFGIIDVVAILPFYLEVIGAIAGAHYFLILRILRILKLGRIYCSERLSVASIARKQHGSFRVLEDEYIEHVAQKHPMIFFIALFPPLLFTSLGLLVLLIFRAGPIASAFSVLFFVFAFLFFLKAWIDFHYDVIYITNHRIILQNRQFFGTRLNDIPYDAITNIRPDNTGILQFIFGFGDIHIETAATSGNREFTNVSDPIHVVERISQNRQKVLDKKNVATSQSETQQEVIKSPFPDIQNEVSKEVRFHSS